ENLANQSLSLPFVASNSDFNKMKTRFLILITFATMLKYAIIVAGGSGTRMGGTLPKQFLLLNKKPVLYYTIRTFLQAYDDVEVIIVLPHAYMDMGQEIVSTWFSDGRIRITQG